MPATTWNLRDLETSLRDDLAACHTDFERQMVRAIGGKEIREAAERFAATRRLTPGERAIAESHGYRPD